MTKTDIPITEPEIFDDIRYTVFTHDFEMEIKEFLDICDSNIEYASGNGFRGEDDVVTWEMIKDEFKRLFLGRTAMDN